MKIFSVKLALIIMVVCIPAFAQDDTRVSATWRVMKYDIEATLPTSDKDLSMAARATLDLRNVSSRPASTLTLRISPLAEIATITIGGASIDFTKGADKIGSASLQRVAVKIPAVQPGANVTATVQYKITLKDNGGLAAISAGTSQFLPTSFWYPTPNSWFFARGADHAPFALKVNAGGRTVVTSGTEAGGKFDQKLNGQPFFIAGNWETAAAGGATVYYPKGSGADAAKRASELAALAVEIKAFMASMLGGGSDVPLRLVAAHRGAGFGAGGTYLLDDGVFRQSKVDASTAVGMADSIARMWLGGSVNVVDDGYGVITEGLSRYLATQFIEKRFGKDIADIERLRQRSAYAAVAARDAPLRSVSPLDDYYHPEVANKGAMVWRLLAKKVGSDVMFRAVADASKDGDISLAEVRAAFPEQKDLLDYMLDQVTETNLLAGLPQNAGGQAKVALRNTSPVDVTVEIAAILANGERMSAPATIKAKSFSEIVFKTASQVKRVEIDADKFYPQTDYSDDVAPRDFDDSDLQLAVKRSFDKQLYAESETSARRVLAVYPRYDDVRVLLGRSLLSLGKTAEAEKEFQAVLDEKLPAPRSMVWATEGLAEVALKNGKAAEASAFATKVIVADADYGASLAARNLRSKADISATADANVRSLFARFDSAAVSNRKADVDALFVPGEITKFASSVAGQTVEWKTNVVRSDLIDDDTMLVETMLTLKLLNNEPENRLTVYRLNRQGESWRIAGVDIFEVR